MTKLKALRELEPRPPWRSWSKHLLFISVVIESCSVLFWCSSCVQN